jgi:hypothetical protein
MRQKKMYNHYIFCLSYFDHKELDKVKFYNKFYKSKSNFIRKDRVLDQKRKRKVNNKFIQYIVYTTFAPLYKKQPIF